MIDILVVGLAVQAAAFTFDGIGLASDFATVLRRFPNSRPASDSYVRLAPADVHDHISAIEVSGAGGARRVRIAFELPDRDGRPVYPPCTAVEATIARRYGPPHEVVRFAEEASRRADRHWRSATEEMRLICFEHPDAGAGATEHAEAVQITPRGR